MFYYLLAGASPELRATLKLTNVKDYHCLNQSAHDTITAKESAEQFGGVQQAMRTLNMTVHETQMWTAVAAVLHLSNVTFAKVNRNNAEGSKVTNTEVVATVASLLRIDAAQLEKSLVSRMTIARTERIVTPMTEMQAADARDALAKAIYGRLFSWCVTFINETTRVKSTAEIKSVGVLDIFGFEDFKVGRPVKWYKRFLKTTMKCNTPSLL